MQQLKDQLYSEPRGKVADFAFDEQVATVFADMIQRSVPGYAAIISMIGVLAGRYARQGSVCYDLGCSLGAGALAMQNHIKVKDCRIIAVDNSESMVRRCKQNVNKHHADTPVEVVCADVRDVLIQNTSVVVLNLVLQFIPVDDRFRVLKKIYDGLLPGSILVLSEKIKFTDQVEEQHQVEMYHAFKKLNGYSDLEINQKRTALENVLILDTPVIHLERLRDIGFSQSYTWFQCFNFTSIVAFK
ncbi:MAG: carboxy-S-adenosyl-L-methionine synthase CmoA [Gammaproteobacteria bacterium]|nr:carboxy-S-adenosyl-L-methionine synthase CmoA [Gammaproteobacteria bacterium]